jgi:RimJ/RimL family protein N-acetyltransferase
MVMHTKRLVLRELTDDDFDSLYAVLGDSDIMRHYPYKLDETRVRNWIAKNKERYRVFGFGLWAVCLKETGEMIGDCGLTMQNINNFIRPEIGYHIRADMQHNGYAKEAASAVRDWAFQNTPFRVLYSYMKADNIASCATAQSIGMSLVEEYRDSENEMTKVYATTRDSQIDS